MKSWLKKYWALFLTGTIALLWGMASLFGIRRQIPKEYFEAEEEAINQLPKVITDIEEEGQEQQKQIQAGLDALNKEEGQIEQEAKNADKLKPIESKEQTLNALKDLEDLDDI